MGCACSVVPQLVKVKLKLLNLEDNDRESFSSSAAMRWVEAQGEPHQLVSSEGGARCSPHPLSLESGLVIICSGEFRH